MSSCPIHQLSFTHLCSSTSCLVLLCAKCLIVHLSQHKSQNSWPDLFTLEELQSLCQAKLLHSIDKAKLLLDEVLIRQEEEKRLEEKVNLELIKLQRRRMLSWVEEFFKGLERFVCEEREGGKKKLEREVEKLEEMVREMDGLGSRLGGKEFSNELFLQVFCTNYEESLELSRHSFSELLMEKYIVTFNEQAAERLRLEFIRLMTEEVLQNVNLESFRKFNERESETGARSSLFSSSNNEKGAFTFNGIDKANTNDSKIMKQSGSSDMSIKVEKLMGQSLGQSFEKIECEKNSFFKSMPAHFENKGPIIVNHYAPSFDHPPSLPPPSSINSAYLPNQPQKNILPPINITPRLIESKIEEGGGRKEEEGRREEGGGRREDVTSGSITSLNISHPVGKESINLFSSSNAGGSLISSIPPLSEIPPPAEKPANPNFCIKMPDFFTSTARKYLHYFEEGTKNLYLLNLDDFKSNNLKSKADLKPNHSNIGDSKPNNLDSKYSNFNAEFRKISLNIDFVVPPKHKSTCTCRGEIFVIGGIKPKENFPNTLYFNWVKNTLEERKGSRGWREGFGVCVIMEEIFIAGGCDEFGNKMNLFEKYDASQDAWTRLSSLNQKTTQNSLCNFSDRFIFKFGGETNQSTMSQIIERYDIALNKWSLIQAQTDSNIVPSLARMSLSIQISPSTLMIFGGYYEKDDKGTNQCFLLQVDESNVLIKNVNERILPSCGGFSCGWGVIWEGKVVGLQNKGEGVRGSLDFGKRRKVIMFDGDDWKVSE